MVETSGTGCLARLTGSNRHRKPACFLGFLVICSRLGRFPRMLRWGERKLSREQAKHSLMVRGVPLTSTKWVAPWSLTFGFSLENCCTRREQKEQLRSFERVSESEYVIETGK